jgi:phosphate transport system substrate-binding protein
LSLPFLLSCRKQENMIGPTMGTIDIVADESIRYIVEQEENIFERSYKYAQVNITYMPEADMIEQFMKDSTRVIMTVRPLTEEEVKYFENKNSYPRQTAFATSALAFLVSQNAPDTAFTYEDMISMFKDDDKGKLFVIENAKSGISNEIVQLINVEKLPKHFYALNSKREVIDYVIAHENAIGIVDWSDISDSDNQDAKELLEKTEIVGITRPADSIQQGFIKPFQYNLQDRIYPFTRDLYIITTTGKSDVSTGFASFVSGDIGQKIILKSGLLPKYQTERIIEIRNSADIKVVK